MSAILNQPRQSLSRHRQLALIICSIAHVYLLFGLIVIAPVAGGAKNFLEFVLACIAEISARGESMKAALMFIVTLLGSSVAIITGMILYLRGNYILATEILRGLLTLVVCYVLAYYGFVLSAAILCFVWLFCIYRFYKSIINRKVT